MSEFWEEFNKQRRIDRYGFDTTPVVFEKRNEGKAKDDTEDNNTSKESPSNFGDSIWDVIKSGLNNLGNTAVVAQGGNPYAAQGGNMYEITYPSLKWAGQHSENGFKSAIRDTGIGFLDATSAVVSGYEGPGNEKLREFLNRPFPDKAKILAALQDGRNAILNYEPLKPVKVDDGNSNTRKILGMVIENLPQLGIQVVTGRTLGAAASAGAMGLSMGGAAHEGALERKMTDEQAIRTGLTDMLLEGALEYGGTTGKVVGVAGKAFKLATKPTRFAKVGAKLDAKLGEAGGWLSGGDPMKKNGVLSTIGRGFIDEATTEAAQQYAQQFATDVYDPKVSKEQMLYNVTTNPKTFKEAMVAGAVGGILGGGMGGFLTPFRNRAIDKVVENQQEQSALMRAAAKEYSDARDNYYHSHYGTSYNPSVDNVLAQSEAGQEQAKIYDDVMAKREAQKKLEQRAEIQKAEAAEQEQRAQVAQQAQSAMPLGYDGFSDEIKQAINDNATKDVPPSLIAAIIQQESGGNKTVVSPAGAQGLMQLMPGTASDNGVTDPFDVNDNVRGGVSYYTKLKKMFGGNDVVAIAAYNAGEGHVQEWIKDGTWDGTFEHVDQIPFAETREYVKNVMSNWQGSISNGVYVNAGATPAEQMALIQSQNERDAAIREAYNQVANSQMAKDFALDLARTSTDPKVVNEVNRAVKLKDDKKLEEIARANGYVDEDLTPMPKKDTGNVFTTHNQAGAAQGNINTNDRVNISSMEENGGRPPIIAVDRKSMAAPTEMTVNDEANIVSDRIARALVGDTKNGNIAPISKQNVNNDTFIIKNGNGANSAVDTNISATVNTQPTGATVSGIQDVTNTLNSGDLPTAEQSAAAINELQDAPQSQERDDLIYALAKNINGESVAAPSQERTNQAVRTVTEPTVEPTATKEEALFTPTAQPRADAQDRLNEAVQKLQRRELPTKEESQAILADLAHLPDSDGVRQSRAIFEGIVRRDFSMFGKNNQAQMEALAAKEDAERREAQESASSKTGISLVDGAVSSNKAVNNLAGESVNYKMTTGEGNPTGQVIRNMPVGTEGENAQNVKAGQNAEIKGEHQNPFVSGPQYKRGEASNELTYSDGNEVRHQYGESDNSLVGIQKKTHSLATGLKTDSAQYGTKVKENKKNGSLSVSVQVGNKSNHLRILGVLKPNDNGGDVVFQFKDNSKKVGEIKFSLRDFCEYSDVGGNVHVSINKNLQTIFYNSDFFKTHFETPHGERDKGNVLYKNDNKQPPRADFFVDGMKSAFKDLITVYDNKHYKGETLVEGTKVVDNLDGRRGSGNISDNGKKESAVGEISEATRSGHSNEITKTGKQHNDVNINEEPRLVEGTDYLHNVPKEEQGNTDNSKVKGNSETKEDNQKQSTEIKKTEGKGPITGSFVVKDRRTYKKGENKNSEDKSDSTQKKSTAGDVKITVGDVGDVFAKLTEQTGNRHLEQCKRDAEIIDLMVKDKNLSADEKAVLEQILLKGLDNIQKNYQKVIEECKDVYKKFTNVDRYLNYKPEGIAYIEAPDDPINPIHWDRRRRISNNEWWYGDFFKKYGKTPTKRDMYDIAYDEFVEECERFLANPDITEEEKNQVTYELDQVKKAKKTWETLEFSMLDEYIKNIDPDDVKARRMMSEEAYQKIYLPAVKKLGKGTSDLAKSAKEGALIYAKIIDNFSKAYGVSVKDVMPKLKKGKAQKAGEDNLYQRLATHEVDGYTADELAVTATITGDEFGQYKDIKELRTKALTYYKENLQGTFVHNDLLGDIRLGEDAVTKEGEPGDVKMTGKGKKKMSYASDNPFKLLAVTHLKDIIANANIIATSQSQKEKHQGWTFYYLHSAIDTPEGKQYVVVTVADKGKGTVDYYNHRIFTKDEYSTIEKATGETSGKGFAKTPKKSHEVASSVHSIYEADKIYKSDEGNNGKNLVALHNISIKNLGEAIKIGGFPVPSIAITKKQTSYTEFGEITLVMDKNVADPGKERVYTRDAWTTVFPEVIRKPIQKALAPIVKAFDIAARETGLLNHANGTEVVNYWTENNAAKNLENALNSPLGKYVYLKSIGQTPELTYRKNYNGDEVVDEKALNEEITKKLADKTVQEGYRKWKNNLMNQGLDVPKIRMGRRKVPLTLDNLVRAMKGGKQNGQKGIFGGSGIGNVIAAGAKKIGSLKSLHQYADRLLTNKDNAEELYKDVRGRVDALITEIIQYAKHKDVSTFDHLMNAADVLVAVQQKKISLSTALAKYDFDVPSDKLAALQEKVSKVTEDIANLPVNYFEAKPNRAVGFNEVKAAVIPKGTPKKIKDFLESQGIVVKEYDPKQEGHREQVTNEAQESVGMYFQKAYHGSPYTFERFDLGEIGTGEGEQAHGWGLYFAKNREIAENYRDVLGVNSEEVIIGNVKYKTNEDGDWYNEKTGEVLADTDALGLALTCMSTAGNKADAIEDLQRFKKKMEGKTNEYSVEAVKRATDAIKLLEENESTVNKPQSLFEVEIPENEELLDEQKTFNEQPEKVKDAIRKIMSELYHKTESDYGNLKGKAIYEYIANAMGGKREASEKLNSLGVKGITYKGEKEGRCFVVFDDKAITTINRYNQTVNQSYAGAYNRTENVIHLFEAANQSTLLHEAAHWWLSMLDDMYHDPELQKRAKTDASLRKTLEKVARDRETIRAWGMRSSSATAEYKGTKVEKEFVGYEKDILRNPNDRAAQERYIQERFARGFERYLMTGEAPTKELRGIFRKFKSWLIDLYKTAKSIAKNPANALGLKNPPKEIQDIFDRMVATQEEIDDWIAKKHEGNIYDANIDFSKNEQENIEKWKEDIPKVVKEKAISDLSKQIYNDARADYKKAFVDPDMEKYKKGYNQSEQAAKESLERRMSDKYLRIRKRKDAWGKRTKVYVPRKEGILTKEEIEAIQRTVKKKQNEELREHEKSLWADFDKQITEAYCRNMAECELETPEGTKKLRDMERQAMDEQLRKYARALATARVENGDTRDFKYIAKEEYRKLQERNKDTLKGYSINESEDIKPENKNAVETNADGDTKGAADTETQETNTEDNTKYSVAEGEETDGARERETRYQGTTIQSETKAYTLSDVKTSFKGQDVKQVGENGFEVTLKNGNKVTITQTGEITRSDGKKIRGKYIKGNITLTNLANAFTLDHEIFHFAKDCLYTQKEWAFIEKKARALLAREGNKNPTADEIEDRAADWYADWKYKRAHPSGVMQKLFHMVYDFVSRVTDLVHKNVNTRFSNLANGDLFERQMTDNHGNTMKYSTVEETNDAVEKTTKDIAEDTEHGFNMFTKAVSALKNFNKKDGRYNNITVEMNTNSFNWIKYGVMNPDHLAKNNETLKVFTDLGKNSMRELQHRRNDTEEKLNKIAKAIEGKDKNGNVRRELYDRIMEEGELNGEEYTREELVAEGIDKGVIDAYLETRKMYNDFYKMVDATKRGVETFHKTVNINGVEALRADTFVENLNVKPLANGRYEVTFGLAKKYPHFGEKVAGSDLKELLSSNYAKVNDIRDKDGVAVKIESTDDIKDNETYSVDYVTIPKPLSNIKGYFHHFFENWMVYEKVTDESGAVSYVPVGSYRSRREALQAFKKLDDLLHEDKKYTREELEAKGIDRNVIDTYMSTMMDNPALGAHEYVIRPKEFHMPMNGGVALGDVKFEQAMRAIEAKYEVNEDEARKLAKGILKKKVGHRFLGATMHRTGQKGYSTDMLHVLHMYTTKATRYIALESFKNKAYRAFERFFGVPIDESKKGGLQQYIKKYIEDVNGNPTRIEEMFNELINNLTGGKLAKWFGTDRPFMSWSNTVMAYSAALKLGLFNISSAAINLTQLTNAVTLLGIKPFLKAHWITGRFTDEERKFLKDVGVETQLGLDAGAGYDKNRMTSIQNKLISYSLFTFTWSEQKVRQITALMAFAEAKRRGMSYEEAVEFAQSANDDANFDYGVNNAPLFIRAGGPVTQMMFQFMKFPVNQIAFMTDIIRHGTNAQRARLMIPLVSAGVYGVPFWAAVICPALAAAVAGAAGDDYDDPELYLKKKCYEWAGDDPFWHGFLDVAFYGLPAKFGVNIGRRMGVGDFGGDVSKSLRGGKYGYDLGDLSLSLLGGVMFSSIKQAMTQWGNGNVIEAIKAFSPALGNAAQAVVGERRTTRGRVATRYDDISTRIIKALGFMPIEETKEGEKERILKDERRIKIRGEQRIIDDFIRAKEDGDKKRMHDLIETMRKKGIKPKRVADEIKRKNQTGLERAEDFGKKKQDKKPNTRKRYAGRLKHYSPKRSHEKGNSYDSLYNM